MRGTKAGNDVEGKGLPTVLVLNTPVLNPPILSTPGLNLQGAAPRPSTLIR